MRVELIYVHNMISPRDILLVRNELERLGMRVKEIGLGTAAFMNGVNMGQNELEKALKNIGFRLLQKDEKEFIELVKAEVDAYLSGFGEGGELPALSVFLEGRMGMPYSGISRRFRKIEERTIESYVVSRKVEKIKNLIDTTSLTIKDIALQMNYRSPKSLAKVFKDATGFSLQDYKKKEKQIYLTLSGQ